MKKYTRHTSRALAAAACFAGSLIAVERASADPLGSIFYIELENHNWTQPSGEASLTLSGANTGVASGSGFSALYQNPAAPYLNSLINQQWSSGSQSYSYVAGSSPVITANNGGITAGVSYASAYHSVLSTPTGSPVSIHPSEPNYVWQEAGSNYGVLNDNDPYAASSGSVGVIKTNNGGQAPQHLTGLLQSAGIPWKSYQEDIDLTTSSGSVNQPSSGSLSSAVAPQNQWTVPLKSFSGSSASYVNPYNHSNQYDFATKHDGSLFFEDTNGSSGSANFSPSNPQASHWAPLQQLSLDLASNNVAKYNLITPNQFNDMHTALSTAFTYNGFTWKSGSDGNRIAVGDNFLSQVVPLIEASTAFQNNGAIVIWTDETEGSNRDTFTHTLAEIVISASAKGIQISDGVYNSTLDYTHSSDLATLQDIYGVSANTATGYLADAANGSQDGTHDLSDMFVSNTMPTSVPEPTIAGTLLAGAGMLGLLRRRSGTA